MPTANNPKTPETATGSGSLGQISISHANPTTEQIEAELSGTVCFDEPTAPAEDLVQCKDCKNASRISKAWTWCRRDLWHTQADHPRSCNKFARKF